MQHISSSLVLWLVRKNKSIKITLTCISYFALHAVTLLKDGLNECGYNAA